MASGTLVLVYYLMPFVVVVVLALLYAWRLGRNDKAVTGVYAALHSPSVTQARNAFDRRVAIAVRQAKLGFRECQGCGFANAQHVTSCVLCGVAVRETDDAKPRSWWSFGRGKQRQEQQRQPVMIGVSDRQQRIRQRKDWTRQIDANGMATWHHSDARPHMVNLPAYVLHTSSHSITTLQELTPTPDIHLLNRPNTDKGTAEDSERPVEVVVDALTLPRKTLDDVSRTLHSGLVQTSVEVIDAMTADAAHIANASIISSSQPSPTVPANIYDSIRNAQLDFPSKLAQFITAMASVFGQTNDAGDITISRFTVVRHTLLNDSIAALATMSPTEASAAIRVEFAEEQGIDAGGVYREWFLLLNEAIIKPDAGIFVCVDEREQTFYLNPHSKEVLGEHHLTHVFAAGRLLGRALLEGNVTGFHLALPLLKIILGLPVGFDDLEYFDPEVYKNLKWLLENDDVELLGLDFCVTEKLPDGMTREVELIDGGSAIDVTDENKLEFIDRKLKYLLFESVHDQLFAFLRGIYDIVPAELLVLFDAEELDYVLSGSDEIDVNDWERNTVTSANLGYYPADELFWKVVHDLSQDERRRLLQFATGSTRVPPGGFSALTSNDGQLCLFSLRGVVAKETRGYLHSHACFNRVDLPMHKNVHEMREAVLAAITGDCVGFTTD